MITIINIVISALGIYFGIGFLFGIYFLLIGAQKIDSVLANSKWKIRLLLLPGAIATWPFLITKSFASKTTKS